MNFKELGENLGLEEDEYRELIDLFIESGSADLQRLQTAMAENNVDQIIRSAHTIKGAAGNLGLKDIQETAGGIEKNAMGNQLGDLAQAIQTLGTQFKTIEAFAHG
jgi:HPt (histidine-containing phosphotransfer) domain-containing protein